MPRPLSHIRVLDLSRILAAPWCTQNLADLGAEVIKVERPGRGDDTRSWGPPFLKDRDGKDTAEAAYFVSVNRGKKSITVDLANPRGQALVRDLAAKSDVLIENYKLGDLDRYGLGYAELRKVNPGIVYCSVTGFGQTGPLAARPGYDFIFQGLGGLMSITGERDDRPGGGPQKVGIAVTDVITGMYASVAITAALNHRQIYGVGQHIDMALLDSLVAFNSNQILNFWASGNVPGRYGNAHANIVPYEVFATADGHIIVATGNDSQYVAFCQVAGHPEWSTDPRFVANSGRLAHRETLIETIRAVMRTRTKRDWLESLEAGGVPCGAINNMQEVFEDEQVKFRGMRVDIPHPSGEAVPSVASPMRFSETPVTYPLAPPHLSEHTDQILRDVLGLDATAINELRSAKVI